MMDTEKILKSLENSLAPVWNKLKEFDVRINAIPAGAKGATGEPGAGVDAPVFEPGQVYRAGAVVSCYLGQYFRALKDTASTPGGSDDWERIGTAGFRNRGVFDKSVEYQDGDFYVKDFGCFMVIGGEPRLWVGRGAKGEKGEAGDPGPAGLNGSTIVGAEVSGFKAVLIEQHGDGSVDHIELDFGPAIRKELDAAKVELVDQIALYVMEEMKTATDRIRNELASGVQ